METVKRGYEPKDAIEFGPKALDKLNAAAQELRFLLNRGYDVKSASTFIGNHHLLSERQRLALALSGSLLLAGFEIQSSVDTSQYSSWIRTVEIELLNSAATIAVSSLRTFELS